MEEYVLFARGEEAISRLFEEQEEDIGCDSSAAGSSTSSSDEVELADDASSSGSTTGDDHFEMGSLMTQLPIKCVLVDWPRAGHWRRVFFSFFPLKRFDLGGCDLTPRCSVLFWWVQEGPVQVLRRQVAVLRVASRGGRPGGPAQAAGEAPQDVAELWRRPQGRAPRPPPRARGRQEAGARGAPVGAEKVGAGAASRGGESGEGGGRSAPVICLGDSPAGLAVE